MPSLSWVSNLTIVGARHYKHSSLKNTQLQVVSILVSLIQEETSLFRCKAFRPGCCQDGTLSLRSKSTDKYVAAEYPHYGVLTADRDEIDDWEKFNVTVFHGWDTVIPNDEHFDKLWGMNHYGGRASWRYLFLSGPQKGDEIFAQSRHCDGSNFLDHKCTYQHSLDMHNFCSPSFWYLNFEPKNSLPLQIFVDKKASYKS